ncbi:hypothetical protein BUALT_Bualt09G0040400 [Buddleja alternifolia]|uniref:Pyruvate kinase n=1 Tax=Buddleja alternifolia TaxID=168488 RepID=A0AAV6X4A4_9LAMI|nr:hypothetical protein BUALT_Bualt09G0040400 [Buddleja alternifolia]
MLQEITRLPTNAFGVDLMSPGSTVILRNAKIDMFKGSMRLAVDKWGRIEVTEPATFVVKEDNNLSLVEYELVNAMGVKLYSSMGLCYLSFVLFFFPSMKNIKLNLNTDKVKNFFPAVTKIGGTLGPRSRSVEVISDCLKAGMSVARFDFSWYDAAYHQETLENLKTAIKSTKKLCVALVLSELCKPTLTR